jgi:hypothetical protein
MLWNALGNGDDKSDFGLNGLDDGVGGKGRGNVDDRRVGFDLLRSVPDAGKDGQAEVFLPRFLGRDTADEFGAILERFLAVESGLQAP